MFGRQKLIAHLDKSLAISVLMANDAVYKQIKDDGVYDVLCRLQDFSPGVWLVELDCYIERENNHEYQCMEFVDAEHICSTVDLLRNSSEKRPKKLTNSMGLVGFEDKEPL